MLAEVSCLTWQRDRRSKLLTVQSVLPEYSWKPANMIHMQCNMIISGGEGRKGGLNRDKPETQHR